MSTYSSLLYDTTTKEVVYGPAPNPINNGTNYSDYLFWNNATWAVGSSEVHIGANAGRTSQALGAIAIGNNAGLTQGTYSIAIGFQAGSTQQANNSIILNASGTALNTNITQSFYVNPIRNTTALNMLLYNSSTSEVVYNALAYQTLTDAATITWTMGSVINNATVTLGGNRTLSFSGLTSGMSGTLIVKQDATGGRTLTFAASPVSRVINNGSGTIVLSTVPNAIDILTFVYDGTNLFWNFGKNYS